MLEVFFQSTKEAISFCEYLFYYNKQIELQWNTSDEWGNQLIFNDDSLEKDSKETFVESMADVFFEHRLNHTMKEVITRKYYYTDVNEIERILDISHGLITGKNKEYRDLRGNKNLTPIVYSLFKEHVEEAETIHFDSIINFRLDLVKKQLTYLVGLAIDEYKREEEHQTFINMLRHYIMNKDSVYHTIHVLQGDSFSFFKETGKPFSKLELQNLMHREPLYIVGLDENEWNLSPLIAMSPSQIYIYGDDSSEPKTLTIINIFQEKVKLKSSHQFPFPHISKKI